MHTIMELYVELSPVSAYMQGVDTCKNKLFIPSKKNRDAVVLKINAALRRCKKKKERIVLLSMKAELELFQSFHFINGIGFALFGYGIKKTPLDSILRAMKEGIRVLLHEYEDAPIGVRILCARAIDSAVAGLKNSSDDREIISLLAEYRKILGIDFPLDRDNILRHLSADSFSGKKSYAMNLEKYNIKESPAEIESACVKWMDRVIPEFNTVVVEIKRKYDLKDIMSIDQFLLEKSGSDKLKTAKKWRKILRSIIEKNLIEISPKHRLQLIETPRHLQTTVSVAGAMPINTMNGKFDNILFLTKEAKVNDWFMIDVMIHEEYGHNLNFSNSLGADVLDRIYFVPTTFTTAEVIASYIEYRFFELSKELPFDAEFKLLYSYVVLRRFLIIYLRAIGDVRVNTGKSSLAEFIDWANKRTGVDKEFIFNEMMSKLYSPGYAPAYPLGMHTLESLREKSMMPEKEFNTKVWALGLPPLQIFLKTVKKWG